MSKFNSKVCTSAEQSKRLLELGLNPETADMFLFNNMGIHTEGVVGGVENNATLAFRELKIPAWSLHRLLYILYPREDVYPIMPTTAYDDIIDEIEDEIKCGVFNKEYLKQ